MIEVCVIFPRVAASDARVEPAERASKTVADPDARLCGARRIWHLSVAWRRVAIDSWPLRRRWGFSRTLTALACSLGERPAGRSRKG